MPWPIGSRFSTPALSRATLFRGIRAVVVGLKEPSVERER